VLVPRRNYPRRQAPTEFPILLPLHYRPLQLHAAEQISFRMILPVVAMVAVPSIAFSQTKDNKALQQLKQDVAPSSQDAARTRNLEQSKVKSNENIDTGTKGAVRAPAPSTQTKAEREAAAIKEYQSKPVTAGPKLKPLVGPPSPGTTRTAAPVSAPKAAALAKVVAPAAAAPARVAAPAAAPVRAAAPAPAAVRPSTTTYTTSSAPSSSSSSSSSSFSSNSRSSSSSSSSGSKKIAQSGYFRARP
jgi:hypothetical protein